MLTSTAMARLNRKHCAALAIIFVLFVLFALLYGRAIIQNDGISYYALTESLLFDHDFRLENQLKKHPEIRVNRSADGRIASYYSCGIAFLYAPFVYAFDLFPALREWKPYAQNVRFPFSHSFGFLVGSIFLTLGSVTLAYWVVVIHQEITSSAAAAFLALSGLLGTPLLFYTVTVPSFAHAADAFLLTAAFVLLILKNRWKSHSIRFANVLLGFVLAFSILLRNNNVVIIPVMVLGAIYLDEERSWRNAFFICLEIFLGALPVLLFHFWYNVDQYEKPVATGYPVQVTKYLAQRRSRFWWIFFHPFVGIYPWAPMAFLGTVGLVWAAIKKRREALIALVIVCTVIISIRIAAFIFPGSTFGQRLLTHLYIFWVFGLAKLYLRFKKTTLALAIPCVLWTFLLFNSYYMLSGSSGRKIVGKREGSSPIEWFQTTASTYSEAKQNGQVSNPIGFLNQTLAAKPYPTLIHILRQP